MHYGKIEEK